MSAELIIDNFAGGGGASTGIYAATGRHPDFAINHSAEALAMHLANHPETEHLSKNIWQVDPLDVVRNRPVGLLWASPDCKHFSKAKGGRPVKRNIRDLAWTIVIWARRARPRVIFLENVEEFQQWGPLIADERGEWKPDPERLGETFKRFVAELRRLGYRVDWRELRACDYGAPTIRKRLFIIARCDGKKIVWPEPTHGPGRIPYRTAAEIIDWSLPCHSIFLSREEGRVVGVRRPLADATMARIAKGVQRYVIEAAEPFIVTLNHGGTGHAPRSTAEPMRTLTASRKDQNLLVAAFLAQHNLGVIGHDVRKPISTITQTGSHQAVVSAGMVHMRGSDRRGADVREPVRTVTAGGYHAAEVRAFLMKYYGTDQDPSLTEPMHTVTTRDRFGLVLVHGEPYQIVDIGMRMLTPRELFAAQGFPADYIIDPVFEGKPLTREAQIRMCGNAVCPPVAEALVRANYQPAARERIAAPVLDDLFGRAA